MPVMLRPSKKARKIAYSIMGVPANMLYKPKGKREEINKKLDFEEAYRGK